LPQSSHKTMKKNNMIKSTKKKETMKNMYQRDHKEAFENAKLKGLNNPSEVMYMYSLENFDYFKNINFRNYTRFPISIKSNEDIVSTYDDNYKFNQKD
jgi:hypothetical protein